MVDPNVILVMLRLKGILGTFEEECEYIKNIYGRDHSSLLREFAINGQISFKHN